VLVFIYEIIDRVLLNSHPKNQNVKAQTEHPDLKYISEVPDLVTSAERLAISITILYIRPCTIDGVICGNRGGSAIVPELRGYLYVFRPVQTFPGDQ
jgi:hypothetical protein